MSVMVSMPWRSATLWLGANSTARHRDQGRVEGQHKVEGWRRRRDISDAHRDIGCA
jgi:hypothetical protein